MAHNIKGDALASGQRAATFPQGETIDDQAWKDRVGHASGSTPEGRGPIFCGCNAKECEGLTFYSAEEYTAHFHEVHGQN